MARRPEGAGAPPETTDTPLDRAAILSWLHEDDPRRLEELWRAADETRRRHVGDEVHLRGLIELSNYCVRACGYCGLRAANREIERYRMSADEILACARKAREYGYGTVVLQSGEDYGIHTDWMADVVRPHQGRDRPGGHAEPRRAPRRRPRASGARPAPTATCCASRPPTTSSTG